MLLWFKTSNQLFITWVKLLTIESWIACPLFFINSVKSVVQTYNWESTVNSKTTEKVNCHGNEVDFVFYNVTLVMVTEKFTLPVSLLSVLNESALKFILKSWLSRSDFDSQASPTNATVIFEFGFTSPSTVIFDNCN